MNPLECESQPCLPGGMLLELKIVLRSPWAFDPAMPDHTPRDVYLCERDPREPAARTQMLYHAGCWLSQVRRICLWAERLGIPIVQEPPGNLDTSFQWPEEPVAAPKAKAKPKSSLSDF